MIQTVRDSAVNRLIISASGGGVTSVSSVDGSLIISPTTGAVVASLNTANSNTWSAAQYFLQGSSTSPGIGFASATNSGIGFSGAMYFIYNGGAKLRIGANNAMTVISSGGFSWANSTNVATGTLDTGLWRNAANIVEVTNGFGTANGGALANLVVADEAYGGTWDGSNQVPTKNAVYDKIQTLSGGVTSISIASANGFAGSSSGGATPALTISTSITGVLKGNGTAISAATAGIDYVTPAGTESLSNKTLLDAVISVTTPAVSSAGYLGAPQNSQSAAYTFVLTDAGKHIYHPDADTTPRTWTIPANSSVAFPIGTVIVLQNGNGAGAITLAITTDTLRWQSSTGSRTIAANGTASLLKVTSTAWRLTGDGIT